MGEGDLFLRRSSPSLASAALPAGFTFFSFSVFFRGDSHFLDLAGDSSEPLAPPASPFPPRLFRFLPLALPLSLLSLDRDGDAEESEDEERERLERDWGCLLAGALSG